MSDISSKSIEQQLAEALAEIETLKKKNRELEAQIENDIRDTKETNLCDSGMVDLVGHLQLGGTGIIDGCWMYEYADGGLDSLKKALHTSSKIAHGHANCKTCSAIIAGIHD